MLNIPCCFSYYIFSVILHATRAQQHISVQSINAVNTLSLKTNFDHICQVAPLTKHLKGFNLIKVILIHVFDIF